LKFLAVRVVHYLIDYMCTILTEGGSTVQVGKRSE